MFAFATVIASPEKYERCALPGIRLVSEPDSVVAQSTDAASMCTAYNEILDALAERDDLEALVLLHEDTEIRDPAFCAKVRARLAEDDLAVLGVAGARAVRSLRWWEGETRGRVGETRGLLDFGGLHDDVDSVDGLLLVLSPWAVRNLRFDADTFGGFHAYDVDLCFQARAAGRRVAVEDIDVFHHTKGGYGDQAGFDRDDAAFRAKWELDPAPLAGATPPPLVSILIPTYNRAGYASEALRSCLAQTHPNLEILVGDNASTDGTPDVLEAVAAGDPRVTIVRRPENLGFYGSTEDLLERATGEYVKFLMDDDLLMPEAIERLVAPMVADPRIAISTSKRFVIDADGRRQPDPPFAKALSPHDVVIDGRQLAEAILTTTTNWIGEPTTALFRRAHALPSEQLWTIDGRDPVVNPDLGLWLKLLDTGPCAYTPLELSSFRMHGSQWSGQAGAQIQGLADWPYFLDAGRARGVFSDTAAERRAWGNILGHTGRLLTVATDPGDVACLAATIEHVAERVADLARERTPAPA